MQNVIREVSNLPPPPPPLPSKSSRKTLIAAIVIVIIVVAAVAGAYVLTRPANSNPSPSASPSPSSSPSASASSSPSATGTPSSSSPAQTTSPAPSASVTPSSSATPTPTGQSYTNFRAGSWANYTTTIYDDSGVVSTIVYEKESISEDTYNGQDCWVLITDSDMTYEGEMTSSTTKIFLSKTTLQGVRYESYMNGELLYGWDLNDTSTNPDTTGEIDPNLIMSYETITVTAGTFTNCAKASTTTTYEGVTTTSYMWANQNVPVYGLVKMESYKDQQLSISMELTAYGG